jgi:hypothetical protein
MRPGAAPHSNTQGRTHGVRHDARRGACSCKRHDGHGAGQMAQSSDGATVAQATGVTEWAYGHGARQQGATISVPGCRALSRERW